MNQGSSTNLIVTSLGTTTSEHIHATVKGIDLLLSGGRNSSNSGRCSSSTGRSGGSGRSKSRWICKESLEGICLGEGVGVQVDGDSDQRSESVSDGVGKRCLGRVPKLERECSDLR